MAFVLLHQQMHTGMLLALSQFLPGFNQATRGGIKLSDARLPGNFTNNVNFDLTEDVWSNRDPTASTDIASGDRKSVGELNTIGVTRPIKALVENSLQSFARSLAQSIPTTSEQFSQMIGEWIMRTKLRRLFNDGLLAFRVAHKAQTANHLLATANSGKANSDDLNLARATMGDMDFAAAGVLVMHSKPYYDLVGKQVADKIPDVAGWNFFRGQPATFNIPTLVTDSPALVGTRAVGSTTVPEYYSLGILPDAVDIKNDAAETVAANTITGKENIMFQVQAEGAYNIALRGFKWDTGNGGAVPSDNAFATATNWDPLETSTGAHKRRGGFCFTTL